MSNEHIYDVVIVGSGPAGLTAGIYAGRATMDTLIIEKDQVGGQVTTTSVVVNYPAVKEIEGTALMNLMKQQAEDFGVQIAHDDVTAYELDGDVKVLHGKNRDYRARAVIIASGAQPRQLGIPGEQKLRGRGVAYCSTCDGELFSGLQVFVVGGGYAAAEEADYLTRYARKVTVLVRGSQFSCPPLTAARALDNPKVEVLYNTEVESLDGDDYLTDATFVNNKTGEKTHYHVADGDNVFGMFIYVGTKPETTGLDVLAKDDRGYITVDSWQQTSIPGVYAAGDVVSKPLRQIVTAASDGAIAATGAEEYVTAEKKRLGIPVVPKTAKPKTSDAKNGNDGANANAAAATAPKKSATVGQTSTISDTPSVPQHKGVWFSAEMKQQLVGIFNRLTEDVTLLQVDDGGQPSVELASFAKEFASMHERLHYRSVAADSDEGKAMIGTAAIVRYPVFVLLDKDGTYTGVKFSGIPTGHEVNSLVLGVYNIAGPGQAVEPELAERIKALPETHIEIGVSLTCHFCPDVVAACQHMAAMNPNVTAEMIDLGLFPELRKERRIMSVPATTINDGDILFGSQTLEQLVTACENAPAV
ncbi:FAD-dependent oxidoreductase [Bifidobacterium callimiconis]|uniref:Thioredoxin reductase n=1 Tax=Bifidobacterium callimiconis TaxID=2306973 RepID=A0A430FCQ1_9BIFI|nr:FAD-dependent oxidoreductase [Bifidobacterium callimiconis]MBT1176716.1 FAD-dependent oxidoreductase [Bifidobacterium callimiconis]RSX50616.1 thioredoxin reductase [Bifidobacterium callimiconis]